MSSLLRTRFLSSLHRHPFLLSRFAPRARPYATHRDTSPFHRRSSWRPNRPDWLDSLDSKSIFWGIIAVNAGIYLTWTLAIQTYVRHVLCRCPTC